MKNKIIIGDLEIFKKKKIQYLIENNLWPLSKNDFNKFGTEFFEFFFKIIYSQNKEMQNYGIVFVRYVLYFLFHIQIRYAVNYAKKNNIEYIANAKNQKIDFQFLESNFSRNNFLYILNLKIKAIIKFFYYNFKIHGIYSFVYIFKEKYVHLGSYSNLSASILKNEKKLAKFHYSEFYLNNYYTSIKNNSEKINNANKIYINPLLDKIQSIEKLYTATEDLEKIKFIFKEKLASIIDFYNYLIKLNITNKKFIVNEPTNIHHKIISFAFDLKNDVSIIHHGNDYCLNDNKIGYILNYGNNSKVIVNDEIMAKNYNIYFKENLYKLQSTNFINFTQKDFFKSYKKDNFQNKFKTNKNIKNKKILLVGYPMNMKREIYESYLWFHSQIILEYNLLKLFKKNNIFITYKAHPDRIEELGNIFDDYCDEIVKNKFEDEYHKYDFILFTYPTTTCFGFAIKTNKKIILLDQGVPWIDKNTSILKNVKIVKIMNSYDKNSIPAEDILNFIKNN